MLSVLGNVANGRTCTGERNCSTRKEAQTLAVPCRGSDPCPRPAGPIGTVERREAGKRRRTPLLANTFLSLGELLVDGFAGAVEQAADRLRRMPGERAPWTVCGPARSVGRLARGRPGRATARASRAPPSASSPARSATASRRSARGRRTRRPAWSGRQPSVPDGRTARPPSRIKPAPPAPLDLGRAGTRSSGSGRQARAGHGWRNARSCR